jgi:hypothetical protein
MWAAGQRVGGRFVLEVRLPGGGMGAVWRARDEATGAAVAVKLLDSADAQDVERFRREIETLAALAHPSIVAHVGDGELEGGGYFLAMEWIDGVTIGERLLYEGFTVAEAVAMVRAVAIGLGAAHRAGVVHRDVKPSNVLLVGGAHDDVKLIDFGIARAAGAVRALTRTGTAIGTPGYMAPEQALGDKRITPAADVFALGALLYECATGKPAFSGTLAAAVLAKIVTLHPPPLELDCPEAPPALGRLVERMLGKRVRERPPDAAAVVEQLDALGPIPAGPRRNARALFDEATVPGRGAPTLESCVVIAARGDLGDLLEPPTGEQTARLRERLAAFEATLDVLATGTLVVQLAGARVDVALRAARCALAIRAELAGWSIVISAVRPEAARTIDDGAALLATRVIADLFAAAGEATIAVDPATASLISHEFVLEAGDPPRLRASRRPPTT